MKQSNWEEDFDAQFPEKDTFASSWAYFEVKEFIREALSAQRKGIVGMIDKVELKVFDRQINKEVVMFYKDAVEETKRIIKSLITNK